MKHANAPAEDPRSAAHAATHGLSKAQKAAAILVAMGKPSAGKLLKFFKQEELKALIEAARMLQTISQGELERIVAEFEGEFTEGAGLLDSSDKMNSLLSDTFSQDEVDVIMGRGKPGVIAEAAPTIWSKLDDMEPAKVNLLLADEHPQTIAVVLTAMKPPAAAKVVLTFGKAERSDIIRRMLALNTVQPAAHKLIEGQLQNRIAEQSKSKNVGAAQARVASLLNELDKSELDEVMSDLEASGQTDVAALRSRLFSFDDIVKLDQKSRVALFDGLSTEIVTLALRECDATLREAVLSAIGARSRRMIESELSAATDVNLDVIMDARKSIASTALRLSGQGLVELPSLDNAA
jgi:flagellar motor switch protein FliG